MRAELTLCDVAHTYLEMQKPEGRIYDDYFDPELAMIRDEFFNPGYHSRVPSGTIVHPIRQSFEYALELLVRADAASVERAISILRKVIPLQDNDPVSQTYGIWSWLYEEPLSAMSHPDWNWADFCGLTLARILLKSAALLPSDVEQAAREALFHAAGSIYRRNVHPGYTNISIMGGVVTTFAGELLGEARMLTYGIRRLKQAVDHYRQHGGFSEYNSPTYTRVVLYDTGVALECIRNAEARESLQFLSRAAWETIACHFHPATGQWAGPHSRDYHVFLQPDFAYYLKRKTGVKIKEPPPMRSRNFLSGLHFGPENPVCPGDLIPRFERLPESEFEYRERYWRGKTDDLSTWGTTWMNEEACLGSVNRDHFFDQRRIVLAYWNGGDGLPVALRLRFLHDDREFASAYLRSAQKGLRVLSGVHLLLGRGDFHPFRDFRENDVFPARDFRMRYELRGGKVEAKQLDDGSFLLSSGEWSGHVIPVPGVFGNAAIEWRITRGEGWVAVDAVCYEGPEAKFAFRELRPMSLIVGLHVCRSKAEMVSAPIRVESNEGVLSAVWNDLEVRLPDHPVPLPE